MPVRCIAVENDRNFDRLEPIRASQVVIIIIDSYADALTFFFSKVCCYSYYSMIFGTSEMRTDGAENHTDIGDITAACADSTPKQPDHVAVFINDQRPRVSRTQKVLAKRLGVNNPFVHDIQHDRLVIRPNWSRDLCTQVSFQFVQVDGRIEAAYSSLGNTGSAAPFVNSHIFLNEYARIISNVWWIAAAVSLMRISGSSLRVY